MIKNKKILTLSEELNIRIFELHYIKKPKNLAVFMRSLRPFCEVYFCYYDENPKKKFVRVGMMNPAPEQYTAFIKWCRGKGKLKSWIEKGDPHMEFMKFRAFDAMDNFSKFIEEYANIYERMPYRSYQPNGLPRKKKTLLDYNDYTQFLHHFFNMSEKSYNQEIFIYRFAAAALDASHKNHIDTTINKSRIK